MSRPVDYEAAVLLMTLLLLNSTNIYMIIQLNVVGKRMTDTAIFYAVACMFSFFATVLIQQIAIRTGTASVLFVISMIYAAFAVVFVIFTKCRDGFSKVGLTMFVVFLAMVLYITLFSRIDIDKDFTIKVSLAYMFNNIFKGNSIAEVRHLFLNIALFIPIGIALPFIKPDEFRKYQHFIIGVIVSILIESIQLLFAIGECDIADVLGNGIGMLLGIVAYRLYYTVTQKGELSYE